jgi:hypothetical protein
MREALSLAFSLLLAVGCGVGETGGPGGGDGDGDGDGDGGGDGDGNPNTLSGAIGESATLSGDIELVADATIESGVELTIASGSSFTAAAGAKLIVQGTLLIDGAAGATVSMIPVEGGGDWGGVVVEAGGSATIRYATGTGVATLMDCEAGAATCLIERIDFEAVNKIMTAAATATVKESRIVDMSNGALSVTGDGNLTVVDSELMTSTHDLIVAAGGTLLVEYTTIGGTVDTYEHCNFHIGSADALTIRYSNILTGEYGMMIGGVSGAVVNYNNFEGNNPGNDVSEVGTVVDADFRYNFWDQGAPTLGVQYDVSSPAGARVAEAGPRI